MRRLFLLLTLLNMVSLGVWFDARLMDSPRVTQLQNAARPQPSSAKPAASGVSMENLPPYLHQSGGLCVRLGPFSDALTADQVSAEIRPGAEAIAMVDARANPAEQRFWLHLEPADEDARNAVLERLQAQGIDDVLALQEGPHAGAVSLGLYASANGRERRIRMLRAAGFEPKVEVRQVVTREHWRRFVLQDQAALSHMQNKLTAYLSQQDASSEHIRIEPIDCVAAAAQVAPATPSRTL